MWPYLVIILCVLIFHFLWIRRELCWLSWQMPGPSFVFLIRYCYHTLLNTPNGLSKRGMLKAIQHIRAHISKTPLRFWFLTNLYVLVMDPDHIQTIINSPHCLNRSIVYQFGDFFAKNGIGIHKLNRWKESRRTLNPVFSTKACQDYLKIFNEEIKVMVSRMKDTCKNQEPVDIQYYISALVFDSIYQTMMGKKMYFQRDENYDLVDHIDKVLFAMGERASNPLLHPSILYKLTSAYKREQESANHLMAIMEKVVDEQKAKWLKNNEELKNNTEDDAVYKNFPIFLIKLFINHFKEKKLDVQEVLGESYTIISAGYETTTVTCVFSILLLAIFPEHQERILKEIKAIMPNLQDYVEYEDLNKCEFLERFIKETLRLFPPIPLMGRSVEQPIKIGKYTIPIGTQLLIPLIMIQREKSFWGPTAEDFDPDRFLPQNMRKIHPFAYQPFAGGPRNCIGIKYANTFLRAFLIHMIKNFKFRTDLKLEDLKFKANLSLKLTKKYMIYVETRF